MNAGLSSHCSLHSCTSSEFGAQTENSGASYVTSLSTDTLYWDPQSEASGTRHQSNKPPYHPNQQQPHHHYQKYQHPHPSQVQPIQPGQMYHQVHVGHQQQQQQQQPQPQQYIQQKPKSWDNLNLIKSRGCGGYGFGYGYLDMVGPISKQTSTATSKSPQSQTITTLIQQQRHSIPRKNSFGRYSTFETIENYVQPPTQFIQETTTTTTTTITTKSTENLLGNYNNLSDSNLSCECLNNSQTNLSSGSGGSGGGNTGHHHHHHHHNNTRGYYSNMNQNSLQRGIPTVSEVTRL